MYRNWLTFICIWIFTTQLNATIVFSDGLTHTINSLVYDDVLLENGSNLDITQGGLVISNDSYTAITDNYPYYDGTNSSVNLSGNATVLGNIILHHDYYASGPETTLVARDDSLIVGTVGGPHIIDVYDNARIIGGATINTGRTAIDNLTTRFNYVNMYGGEVIGGHGGNTGGYAVDTGSDSLYVQMTNGIVRGGMGDVNGGTGLNISNRGSLSMTGGAILGGDGGIRGGSAISTGGGVEMEITTGQIRGGNGGDYGGSAMYLRSVHGSGGYNIEIFGGEFDAGIGSLADGWIFDIAGGLTRMSIYGGMFGYDSVGAGFNIFGNSIVDVHGWDLNIDNDLLTGYLLDGNWIEVPVALGENTVQDRGLHLFNYENVNVPEPSVLLLMVSGLSGFGLIRMKKQLGR